MAYYQKRKNGTYLVRVSNGFVNGKQIQHSTVFRPEPGATQAEIERSLHAFGNKFERCIRDGTFTPGMNLHGISSREAEMLLNDFIDEKYYPIIEQKLSPNTVRFYKSVCNSFLIPSFGRMRLCDITYHELQRFIDYLAHSAPRKDGSGKIGLSPGSAKRYATVFRSIITEACRYGYLENNTLRHDSITYPKQQPSVLEAYTAEEATAFMKALETEPPITRAMLMLALVLGLRRAEIVALKWQDIDFDKMTVDINKSAYKVKGMPQGLKDPKSRHGFRKIFFPDSLGKALEEWKNEQERMKETAGEQWRDYDFVFTNPYGKMISVYTPSDMCAAVQRKYGLRHLKLHGLRHTCGSLLMSMGTDAETVRDILGHDSVRTTDIYLHPYDRNKKNAAVMMEALLGGKLEVQDN